MISVLLLALAFQLWWKYGRRGLSSFNGGRTWALKDKFSYDYDPDPPENVVWDPINTEVISERRVVNE